jgi:hypothetical protein
MFFPWVSSFGSSAFGGKIGEVIWVSSWIAAGTNSAGTYREDGFAAAHRTDQGRLIEGIAFDHLNAACLEL